MKNARKAMSKSEFAELFRHDQFNYDMMNTKTPFNAYYYNFREGDCSLFAPTFKIIPGTNLMNHSARIPSWTDRITYRSKKIYDSVGHKDEILTLLNYDSNNQVKSTDHRPVYAQFLLRMDKYIDLQK